MPRREAGESLEALKVAIATLVANNLSRFVAAGKRINDRFGVAAYRVSQARRLRTVRKTLTRKQVLASVDGKATRHRARANKKPRHIGESAAAPNALDALVLDVSSFPYRRELPLTERQDAYRRLVHSVPEGWNQVPPDPGHRGEMRSHVMRRFGDALNSLTSIDRSMDADAAEEVLLLLWLTHQRNADRLQPSTCEFQSVPWKTTISREGAVIGRDCAADRFGPDLAKIARIALGVVRQSVLHNDVGGVSHPAATPRLAQGAMATAPGATVSTAMQELEFHETPRVKVPELRVRVAGASASARPTVIRGKTAARLAWMVMQAPDQDHPWTALARAGGNAGHWTAEPRSLARVGRRILAALPREVSHRWEQDEHSVRWSSK